MMPQELLVRTLSIVRRHPWWHARARLALSVLRQEGIAPPANIADLGCGWGTNIDALEASGYRVTGIDISRQILECIDRPERNLVEADLTQNLPPSLPKFDGFLALDVIEHLDDDFGAVGKFAQFLRPGGIGVISVPARPDLFSDFDKVQGHRRRYLPERLREAVTMPSLEVVKIFWWGQWMVPVLTRTRKKETSAPTAGQGSKTYIDYLRIPPWPIPWAMNLFYALEHNRAPQGKLTTGTSLFAVVRRT